MFILKTQQRHDPSGDRGSDIAPRITPIAWINSIKPALTKLTTITVVADDDWMMTVMMTPVMIEMNRFFVIMLRIAFIRFPADFCNPR